MLRFRLSLMMAFQYMMYSVWWVPLAAYLTNMEVGSTQKSIILSSMAIGCLASPVIGMVADRFIAGQRLLMILNLLTAIFLFMAGRSADPDLLFISLLLTMIFYMPSWSLTSAIAMTHLPSVQFTQVRMFGSVGWVSSGIFSLVASKISGTGFDGTNLPFYIGAGVALAAALSNLTLPDTPPPARGKRISVIDLFGLGTVKLMKERNFLLFVILSFLSLIPFAMYYSYFSEFLLNIQTRYITVTINWGVLAEMGFMILIPLFIKRYGLRTLMIFGLAAMVIRYLSFYIGGAGDQHWMYYIGILIHGLIFGFFFVGGQIYIDRKAPDELKSQAQGFIFLVTFGLGLLAGNMVCGKIISLFTTTVNGVNVYDWNTIWGITSLLSVVLLLAFILLFKDKEQDNLKKV